LYLDAILRVEEGERHEITNKLRNDILQSVLALVQRLGLVISANHPIMPKFVKENLENIRSLAIGIYPNLPSCAQVLSPSILEDLGLVAAVEWLCDEPKRTKNRN
jgi:two-component system sensor histidine kinase DegS